MLLILGSQSPRRREILSFFNILFEQVSPQFDEDQIPFLGNPIEYVKTLSKGKADSLKENYPDAVILTADTIVYFKGRIFGKPKDLNEAKAYLKELSGQWHSVYTGLTIVSEESDFQEVEETRVLFNSLTDEQMTRYHESLPFADKAGGYMIQGSGGLIVNKIDGCYYNVMGLPVNALRSLLNQAGIDLWNHFKE